MTVAGNLTAEELRVLACLIEKSYTTPDQYPLSSNALTNACNQKSSRDPVVDYPTKLVDETLQLLRDAGWVRMIRASGNRTFKHRHIVDEALNLATPELAVLAVLALRGAQSPGELKTRTERYHGFADLGDVERSLMRLRDRERPLVHNVGRASGQSQDRWIQLLGPVDPAIDLSSSLPPTFDTMASDVQGGSPDQATAPPSPAAPSTPSAAPTAPPSPAAPSTNAPASSPQPIAGAESLVRSESA
ncbi:MAG: YceH family protein, partial [Acidimicrobiales bacterium]